MKKCELSGVQNDADKAKDVGLAQIDACTSRASIYLT